MIENKNIDRVFQENLKDLEIYPNDRVWKNIENHLQGKPQRNVIALWQKLSGVAIIFLLMFSVSFGYFKLNKKPIIKNGLINNSSTDNSVVNNTSQQEIPVISLKEAKDNLATVNKDNQTNIKEHQINSPNYIETKDIQNTLNIDDSEFDNIAIANEIESKKKTVQEKPLFDISLISQNKNQITGVDIKNEKDRKWSIGPSVSPVYYNTLQKGSPISSDLENNNKTTDEALSYGVKVDYQLSNKFIIQSGVNKVELAYTTKGVNTVLTSSKLPNHNINTTNSGLHISSSNTSNANSQEPINQLSKSNVEGDLNQSIEYVEIPLEMKYNLFKSRVGLNVVGGFSTFILTNNQVSMVSLNSTTKLGEANNLNVFNFSGNVGFDIDYKINKDWFLNLTPMVKYQFNTFSNSAGNFQPYYFGVYSGINYRF
ncbi:MAG: hypothetical protein ABFR32_06195 [Bacteroidota bacterium]